MAHRLIVIFVCLRIFSFAQIYKFNDAQVWFNLYLEKKVGNKFLIHLNQQDRWINNITTFNFAYADVGITYKVNKDIKVFADYVFTQKRLYIKSDEYPVSFGTVHQYYIAATFKKDFRRWRFMYRAMYQFQYNNPYTSSGGLIPYHYDRNKFIVKYELNKRLTAYGAEELYIPLNNPRFKGIDRTRTFAGVFINTFRKQQLELYFMYQNRLHNGGGFKQRNGYNNYSYILEKDFVYGIGYSYEF